MTTIANHPETAVTEGRAVAIRTPDEERAGVYVRLTSPGMYQVIGIETGLLVAGDVSRQTLPRVVGQYWIDYGQLDEGYDWTATVEEGQKIIGDPYGWAADNIADLVADMTCRSCDTDFVGVPHPSSEYASINSAGLYTCDRCNDLF